MMLYRVTWKSVDGVVRHTWCPTSTAARRLEQHFNRGIGFQAITKRWVLDGCTRAAICEFINAHNFTPQHNGDSQ